MMQTNPTQQKLSQLPASTHRPVMTIQLFQNQPLLPRRHWGTFGVNLIACFALGLLTALQSRCGPGSERLMLLLGAGFLGGFSTFSTFIAELVQSSQAGQGLGALTLLVASVAGGLVAWTGSGLPDLLIGGAIGVVVLIGARRILALR